MGFVLEINYNLHVRGHEKTLPISKERGQGNMEDDDFFYKYHQRNNKNKQKIRTLQLR